MKTKESVLRQMLLEIALGVDQTAGVTGKDDKETKTDRKGIIPVTPSFESPVQLSQQQLDISDPDFIPANRFELARALYSVGELTPDELVEKLYLKIKDVFEEIVGDEIV